ncbi:hypothetical protein ACDT12_13250 [Staphylococcus aureus]
MYAYDDNYGGGGDGNDVEMVMILTIQRRIDQQKSQMALWSIMAAPLIMSNDRSLIIS